MNENFLGYSKQPNTRVRTEIIPVKEKNMKKKNPEGQVARNDCNLNF